MTNETILREVDMNRDGSNHTRENKLREVLERIYFCGGDDARKKKDIDQALNEIMEIIDRAKQDRSNEA